MKKVNKSVLTIILVILTTAVFAENPKAKHYLSISHEVSDYNTWKIVYDQFKSDRLQSGIVDLFVKKDINNTNSVTVFSEVTDLDKAKAFMSSTTLQEAMKKAGVTSAPEIIFYTSADKYGEIQTSSLVTTITHSVADYRSWKKIYDSSQEVRENAVLIDHLILRSINDENVITVLGNATSAAKFNAFISDPELKEIMENAGVTSKPEVAILF